MKEVNLTRENSSPELTRSVINTMVQGGASYLDMAQYFGLTYYEFLTMLADQGIALPTLPIHAIPTCKDISFGANAEWLYADLLQPVDDLAKLITHRQCFYCTSKDNLDGFSLFDHRFQWLLYSDVLCLCKSCASDLGHIIYLKKSFNFSSSHSLSNCGGQQRYSHGHTFTLGVTLRLPVHKAAGVAIDPDVFTNAVQRTVIDLLNFNNINGIFPKNVNPSVENLLFWIWRQLSLVAHLKGLEELELSDVPSQKYLIKRNDVVAYVTHHLTGVS